MNPRPPKELSPEDCRVLDLLAEGGFDPAGLDELDAADHDRGEAITALLGTLNQYPVEDASPELVDATLARIQREEDERPQRMNIENHLEARNDRALGGRRWRFPDIFATAAVVLIAVAVMWPITNTVRQRRMVDLDSANMSENGRAMALYAGANNGSSPMQATASLLPDPFDWMGKHSGDYSDHIHEKMAPYASNANDFRRPEAAPNTHRYSYQHWQTGDALLVEGRVVAANTNPLSGRSQQYSQSEASQNSLSHGGRGQNLLFGDGSVQWLEAAQIDDDRLWDPGTDENGDVIDIIVGGSHGDDVLFLVH
jgi:hypothetical protein